MDDKEFQALTTEETFRQSVLRELKDVRGAVEKHALEMNARLTAQDEAIAANTASTKKTEEQTGNAITLLNAVNSGATALMWLGKVGKWLGYILTPIATIWAIRHGKIPGG